MLHLLNNSEANLYPARIAEELGFPEVSVHRSLEKLEKRGFAQMQTLGPLNLYKLTESGIKHANELTKIPGVAAMYTKLIGSRTAPGNLSATTIDDLKQEFSLRLKGYGFSAKEISRIMKLLRSK